MLDVDGARDTIQLLGRVDHIAIAVLLLHRSTTLSAPRRRLHAWKGGGEIAAALGQMQERCERRSLVDRRPDLVHGERLVWAD